MDKLASQTETLKNHQRLLPSLQNYCVQSPIKNQPPVHKNPFENINRLDFDNHVCEEMPNTFPTNLNGGAKAKIIPPPENHQPSAIDLSSNPTYIPAFECLMASTILKSEDSQRIPDISRLMVSDSQQIPDIDGLIVNSGLETNDSDSISSESDNATDV